VGANGTIYFGALGGTIFALNPDGTLLWNYEVDGNVQSSPAIAEDGTIYVGSDDGSIYAIYGDSPLASSAWPKFRHDNQNTGRAR